MEQTRTASIPDVIKLAHQHYTEGRYRKAANLAREVLKVSPNRPRALHLLGLVAYSRGRNNRAEQLISRAINGRADLPEFHNSLGMTYMAMGRPADALATYQTALRLLPPSKSTIDLPRLYGNIANALNVMGRFEEAIAYHDKALAINPKDMTAAWNRAHIFLVRGEFAEGWKGYESRMQLPNRARLINPHKYASPRWDGTPFPDKTLLVHDEQGLGDIIQFVRYLPLVKALGGTVLFETRPAMLPILENFPGIDQLIARKAATEEHVDGDYHVPLISLPGLFGTTLENLPAGVPYLYSGTFKTAQWRERFANSGLRVGVCWAGNLENIPLRHRACQLAQLAPVLHQPGVHLYGLQKGPSAADIDKLQPALQFQNFGNKFEDFTDTAAMIANLDLVITIDTAVAHLAGAMGKPVWMMLSFPPDFRWLLEREDCPWYPSMRIIRQRRPNDWEHVFARVRDDLTRLAAGDRSVLYPSGYTPAEG